MLRLNNFIGSWRRSGSFIAALLLVASLASPSAAALIMEYEETLIIAATGERAIRPTAVTCDGLTSEICVTDAQYSVFHVLNGHGIEVFKTGGASTLSFPIDGSLTSDGDFIFIDRDPGGAPTIRRLNFMGEPVDYSIEIPAGKWEPRHLALLRNDDILTLDSFNNILAKHDSKTGALLWLNTVTDDDATDLQLGRPGQASDGRIYVPSGMLHSVFVFSEDGRRLDAFGEFGSGSGKIVFPVGIAFGRDESILVLDGMRDKVLVYGPDHVFLSEFGSMGWGPGQFYHPAAIAASNDGRVYVAQGYGGRVQVFRIHDTTAE